MKILVESEIGKAIRRCNPSKVAVAYIGADWNKFVRNADRVDAIIVSPTFGSNPRAITSLVGKIRWDRVFFLDELHAKMYIGNEAAVIGSANLTRNGLSGEKLVELCVEVEAEESLRSLNKAFDDLKRRAQEKYPTADSKKAQLKELENIWNSAIANRIVRSDSRITPSFVDFEPLGKDHFYVLWYQPIKPNYSADINAIGSLMVDDIHFTNADNVKKNKWVLVWHMTDSYTPHRTERPYWLYIHEVYTDGVVDRGYDYPKCAIQRKDLEVPSPPFEITGDVSVAFKKAIQEKEIARYLIQKSRNIFSLAHALKGMPPLISRMKEYMANKANAADAKRRRG